jgi:type IV fimbrial biogenesis protein FimT
MSEACKTMIMEKEKGFTLIELLITIVVVSILLATGVPSIMQMVKNNRVTTQANKLVTAIQLARNEAVKRGTRSTICAANAALDDCSSSTNWATGWIVFSNLDGDMAADTGTDACLETEDCLMRASEALGSGTLTGGDTAIHFLPNGYTVNGPVTFTLKADDCKYEQERSIIITLQGHTTISQQACTP